MKWLDKKDPDGNRIVELENSSITCYFYDDEQENGSIVDNHTNDVLTWNSTGVSHMNLQSKDFTVMITDDNQLTLTYGKDNEKNLILDIDTLIEIVKTKGKTIEELEKEREEKENGEQSESVITDSGEKGNS